MCGFLGLEIFFPLSLSLLIVSEHLSPNSSSSEYFWGNVINLNQAQLMPGKDSPVATRQKWSIYVERC